MGAAQSLTSLEFRYGQSHQYFEDLINTLDSQEGNSMDFSELERELEKRGKELMLKLLQEHLNNRSPGKTCEPVKDADGEERTRIVSHDRQIETIFGRVELNREGYGQEGCDSLHPLDAELNIPPELYSLIGPRIKNLKRPPIENKRVWASIEKMPEEVIEEAFAEARNRDPDHEKKWVALVDGNKNQIDNLRLFKILQGKAGHMAGGMRRSATRRKMTDKERKQVDKCATYLLNKSPYLRYDRYLSEGLPIGTGVIEGACKHLVKDRIYAEYGNHRGQMDASGGRSRITLAGVTFKQGF